MPLWGRPRPCGVELCFLVMSANHDRTTHRRPCPCCRIRLCSTRQPFRLLWAARRPHDERPDQPFRCDARSRRGRRRCLLSSPCCAGGNISGDLQATFAIGGAQLGNPGGNLYVYTLMQIPTGVLADTLGPRRILFWAVSWWRVSARSCSASRRPWSSCQAARSSNLVFR